MPADYPIFISYRRSDLSLEAEWLYNLIRTFFGEQSVFLDTREIASGTPWDDTLRTCVSSASLVLILIGPRWMKEQTESGQRRLDDPGDWVRKEVIAAIDAHRRNPEVRVYPVLVNGAALPRREWLPEPMMDLVSFQAESKLHFDVRDYLGRAAGIHAFLAAYCGRLRESASSRFEIVPFSRERVPNPFDISGFPLPEELRLLRPERPFKGLQYFERADASIFFGRRREIGEVVDVFRKGNHVVRLFGQSGVGKSSLLFAGLLPRLEANGWYVGYRRRDSAVSMARQLDDITRRLQADPSRDALVILDQVEEILTNPNVNVPTELQDLARATADVSAGNAQRTRPVRMMWSYRKEYDVNMKSVLRDHGVYSSEYWLEDLDSGGMREAIGGITRDRDLVAEYRLDIQPGVEDAILADLFGPGRGETATPLLQVLLRKMWDHVGASGGTRQFTRDLYDACKSSDIEDLLAERLQALVAPPADDRLRSVLASGLALDLLRRFVTGRDTSLSLGEAELSGAYADPAVVKALLQRMVDCYLVLREDGQKYRLSHDTLARAVRALHGESMLPGQRASRLLESKKYDIESPASSVDFSKADLKTLDEGLAGMRTLTAGEQLAVERSRQKRQQEEQELEERNRQLERALASEEEQRHAAVGQRDRALITQSLFLSSLSRQQVEKDRYDQAVLLALEALPTDLGQPNRPYTADAEAALYNAIHHHRKTVHVRFDGESLSRAAMSPDGARFAVAVEGGVRIFSSETADQELALECGEVEVVDFSPDGAVLLVASESGLLRLFNLRSDKASRDLNVNARVSLARFSPDGGRIVSVSGRRLTLWDAARFDPIATYDTGADIQTAQFSADGTRIVAAVYDRTARLLDALTGKELAVFRGHEDVVDTVTISADNHLIATGAEDLTARIWDAESGKQIHVLEGHRKQSLPDMPNGVSSVSFHPSGLLVATGGFDGTARVWSVNNGSPVHELRHRTIVEPGDTRIASAVAIQLDDQRSRTGIPDLRRPPVGGGDEAHSVGTEDGTCNVSGFQFAHQIAGSRRSQSRATGRELDQNPVPRGRETQRVGLAEIRFFFTELLNGQVRCLLRQNADDCRGFVREHEQLLSSPVHIYDVIEPVAALDRQIRLLCPPHDVPEQGASISD